MKGIVTVSGLAILLAVMWASGLVHGEPQTELKELIFVSADDADFEEVVPDIAKAVLWGDEDTGPYGAFTRFEPGVEAGMHKHTNDVWIVVIEGAYVYKDDAGEKRVEPGHFIRIPGGMEHQSGGDAEEGALFYEESSGKFDLVPVK